MGGVAKEYITKIGREKYFGGAHKLSTSGDALRLVPYITGEIFDKEGKPKHLHAGVSFSIFVKLALHGRKIKMK
jgi:hypothetical protein